MVFCNCHIFLVMLAYYRYFFHVFEVVVKDINSDRSHFHVFNITVYFTDLK